MRLVFVNPVDFAKNCRVVEEAVSLIQFQFLVRSKSAESEATHANVNAVVPRLSEKPELQ
jgi:hypothetical protein